MDLLVFKTGEKYLRIIEDGFDLCGMNKASVYPVLDKQKVLDIYNNLKVELVDLKIKQLTIIEKDFEGCK